MVVCNELLTNGVCRTELCTASHVLDFFCSTCNIICSGERTFNSHLAGRKHRTALKTPTITNCHVCPCLLANSSPYTLEQHSQGATHRRRLAQLQLGSGVPEPWYTVTEGSTPSNVIRCDACSQNVPNNIWSQHLSKESHVRRSRLANFQSVLRETEKDRHGVEVSHGVENEDTDAATGINYGTIDPGDLQEIRRVVTLRLTTPASITLISVRLASAAGHSARAAPQFHVSDTTPTNLQLRRLTPVQVYFRPLGHRGYFSDRLELTFHDTSLNKSFTITRPLRATIGNASDLEQLRPSAPYVRPPPRPRRDREEKLVDGIKPPSHEIPWVVKLPKANMPASLRGILESHTGVDSKVTRIKQLPVMPNGIAGAGTSGYGRFWETLLHVEEYQAQIDLERYDQEDVALTKHREYYFLKVPGLAEKRPSVLKGDSIKVRPHDPSATNNTTWYIGYVHVVRRDEVGLRFARQFLPPTRTRFDVRFCLNRIPLLRMHQALATAFVEPRVLFPAPEHDKQQRATQPVVAINPLVGRNPPQLLAVNSIMRLAPGSPPFAIFGPPGTGKTVTAVESMLQLLLSNRSTKILATAPSNSAADLIAYKLLESKQLRPGELLRLNALSRNPEDIQLDSVLTSSYAHNVSQSHDFDDDTDSEVVSFRFPGVDRLLEADLEYNRDREYSRFCKHKRNVVKPLKDYRVIVATCVTASVPYQLGLPRGHFDWIFVDEAGQACEPEGMIAIKTLAGPNTNIVLSGDPRQLGPVIRSPIAISMGLGISLLERLMNLEMYRPPTTATTQGRRVVKLSKNWRNHAAILRYPNERFYANELEACAPPNITDILLNWPELGRRGFPIIFENIAGKDMREASSPSWYNPMEVSRVRDYVRMLRDLRRPFISTTDIGVITPYNQQVRHIRTMLRGANGEGIKVGSVEEFQGQERKVIIVSTVRSSADEIEFDLRHTLGFVANDRRFNVTVTRAQALLIIVGDASVLGLDPLWRSFLSYIHEEGGWKGIPIPWQGADAYNDAHRRRTAMNDLASLIERTRTMNLSLGGGGVAGDADDVDVGEGNVDRPWREDE